MVTVYQMTGDGRRAVEWGTAESVRRYLDRTTARRVQLEIGGERSPVLTPAAAERYLTFATR